MGLQKMTMKNAIERDRVFAYNKGTVLGNGRVVVADEYFVKKYYFNKKQFEKIKDCVEMMKIFHPDLFVDMFEKDFLCVTMNRIDCLGDHYNRSKETQIGDYRSDIKNYLKLYQVFGNKKSKRDLTPNNLLYRKSDLKFFIIDWDNVQHFNNEEECYIFYRDQLCDYRWTEWYELDRNEIVKIFKEEWKLISS